MVQRNVVVSHSGAAGYIMSVFACARVMHIQISSVANSVQYCNAIFSNFFNGENTVRVQLLF